MAFLGLDAQGTLTSDPRHITEVTWVLPDLKARLQSESKDNVGIRGPAFRIGPPSQCWWVQPQLLAKGNGAGVGDVCLGVQFFHPAPMDVKFTLTVKAESMILTNMRKGDYFGAWTGPRNDFIANLANTRTLPVR
jgi:hypothetical protein